MLIATVPITSGVVIHAIQADGIEFRLDYLKEKEIDLTFIKKLKDQINLPVIFTLRKRSQGGLYNYSESERLQQILLLCTLNPDYIDLEYDTSREMVSYINQHFPKIKLICSYHDFTKTPIELEQILQAIYYPNFDFYKIATFAQSTCDALRMLVFAKSQPNAMTAFCMGEYGKITRIASPVVGNMFTYAHIDHMQATAPGQLSLYDLINHYHYEHLNQETHLYALLGNPIEKSVGHILHNQALRILQKNALYIKLTVSPSELVDVIAYCKLLAFKGLSITMPLKEHLPALLDKNKGSLNAINTIQIEGNCMIGSNTDGLGAITVLQHYISLRNKTIVILGAGGAASAIAEAAAKAGAHLIIFNRTRFKANKLAKLSHGTAYSLNELSLLTSLDYAVIINTIPEWVIPAKLLKPSILAMDVTYQPIETDFLREAKKAGCLTIPGYLMYIEQALLQIDQWHTPTLAQHTQIRRIMTDYFV